MYELVCVDDFSYKRVMQVTCDEETCFDGCVVTDFCASPYAARSVAMKCCYLDHPFDFAVVEWDVTTEKWASKHQKGHVLRKLAPPH